MAGQLIKLSSHYSFYRAQIEPSLLCPGFTQVLFTQVLVNSQFSILNSQFSILNWIDAVFFGEFGVDFVVGVTG